LGHRTDNELVIQADVWVSRLPQLIEAVEFPAHASDAVKAAARRVHRAFRSAFGERADPTPLVEYDSTRRDAPFTLVLDE
jgi:hypothetical protein